jgi:hypothetical protein
MMASIAEQITMLVARWLSDSPMPDEANVEFVFESTWHVAAWVPLTLFLLAAAGVFYLYFLCPSRISRRLRVTLLCYRVLLVGLIIWMMFGLAVRRYRTDLPDLILLLDDSASMTTSDRWPTPQAAQEIRTYVQQAGLDGDTRFRQLQAMLLNKQASLLATLDSRYRLKINRLSTRAPSTLEAERAQFVEGLRDMEASHDVSDLGDRVRDIVDSQRGRPTAAIVVVTDGISTRGRNWDDAADYARTKGIPLFLIGVGNDQPAQDIEIKDLLAEDMVYVNDIVDFSFALASVGYENEEVAIRLHLADDQRTLATCSLTAGADRQVLRGNLRYRVREEGIFDFVVETDKRDGETDADNNMRHVRVEVRNQTIRVLYVQHSPSYEYRFLKNVLGRKTTGEDGAEQNPVQLHTVLQEADLDYVATDETSLRVFPVQREELFAYDVLILGDADPSYWTSGVMENMRQFVVERGGGLLVMAGPKFMPHQFAGTPLEEVFPTNARQIELPDGHTTLNTPFRPQLTPIGTTMPFLMLGDNPTDELAFWSNLPPLYWLAVVDSLKPGVMVLAEDATRTNGQGQRIPVISLQYVGAGKVITHFTDETYRWRYRRGDVVFSRYWQQVVRYLSRGGLGGNRQVELTSDRKQYVRGEPVQLRVRYLDDRLAPADDDGVTVMLEQSAGRKRRLTLERTSAERGIFEGTLYNLDEGTYHGWIVTPTMTGGESQCDFEVHVPPGEFAKLETATAEMRQAAKKSRGKYYPILKSETLPRDLPEGRHVRIESLTPEPIWNSWKIASLFVLLIGSEWFLRKRVGMA